MSRKDAAEKGNSHVFGKSPPQKVAHDSLALHDVRPGTFSAFAGGHTRLIEG
jgi:hypothetical protein